MNKPTCKTCNETLKGKFCHNCGEKVVEESDFSIKTLSSQIVDGVFNVDSKFYKTFVSLLFKPGKLTISYIEGIRKPYMKPIQVFLITNILFFLLLTQADILRIPAKYYFNSGRNINIEAKTKDSKLTETQIYQKYDKVSSDVSKSLVILIVPLLAFILWLLFLKSRFLFGMQLIFAMHYLSFFFLICLLAIVVSKFGNRVVQIFIVGINLTYIYIAMRKFYKNNIIWSIIKAIAFIISFAVITLLYREFISAVSFKLL